ncbi:MAG: hypothetical protein ABJB16_03090 [Saprospiraceae bacterium]
MNKRNIIINSALLFSIAFLWQMTLHELGHFTAAILLHAKDVTLYHNYANYNSTGLSMSSMLIIVSAGPLFSLFIGALFHFLCSKYKKRNSFFLFLLYMSSFGYICFCGYLMIAPFFQNGDTGFVFHQLGFPIWLVFVFAGLGVAFVLMIGKWLGKYFAEMATAEIMNDKEQQNKFADVLIKYPLFIGVVITTLLNLPVVAFLSLLYPLGNPMNMFWIYGYVTDTTYATDNANKQFDKLEKNQPVLIGVFVLP